jgi:hypothetical protein
MEALLSSTSGIVSAGGAAAHLHTRLCCMPKEVTESSGVLNVVLLPPSWKKHPAVIYCLQPDTHQLHWRA